MYSSQVCTKVEKLFDRNSSISKFILLTFTFTKETSKKVWHFVAKAPTLRECSINAILNNYIPAGQCQSSNQHIFEERIREKKSEYFNRMEYFLKL